MKILIIALSVLFAVPCFAQSDFAVSNTNAERSQFVILNQTDLPSITVSADSSKITFRAGDYSMIYVGDSFKLFKGNLGIALSNEQGVKAMTFFFFIMYKKDFDLDKQAVALLRSYDKSSKL